jgi:ferric-dicitrate binding protein FerR (iron transport regulator)
LSDDPAVLTHEESEELQRRRRGRNLAMLAALLGVAVLFYLIALVKLGRAGMGM